MSEEEDEEAAAAELARLEAEVVRWQREVKELADAKDGLLPGVAEARQELFADAEEELKGAEGAKEVAQIAMQRRFGQAGQVYARRQEQGTTYDGDAPDDRPAEDPAVNDAEALTSPRSVSLLLCGS
jgi:hypothetical protein